MFLSVLHHFRLKIYGSLQVAGFVAALRMFFAYGLTSKSQVVVPTAGVYTKVESKSGPYRPPHVRKQNQSKDSTSFSKSDIDYMSSDSDLSDSDGSAKGISNFRSSKVRVAAIVCIQDLCRSDPKSFTVQWSILLPSSDVLQAR